MLKPRYLLQRLKSASGYVLSKYDFLYKKFRNRVFVYSQDRAKARLGIFLSFRKGDYAYLDLYWYWGGLMINLWRM